MTEEITPEPEQLDYGQARMARIAKEAPAERVARMEEERIGSAQPSREYIEEKLAHQAKIANSPDVRSGQTAEALAAEPAEARAAEPQEAPLTGPPVDIVDPEAVRKHELDLQAARDRAAAAHVDVRG